MTAYSTKGFCDPAYASSSHRVLSIFDTVLCVGCLGKEVGLVRAQAIFRLVVLSILCVSVLLPTRWVLATPALKPQSFSVAIGESLNRPPIPAAARGSVYTVNTKDLTAPGDGLPRGWISTVGPGPSPALSGQMYCRVFTSRGYR